MTKTTNLLARAAMTLFLAVFCSVGTRAQSEVVNVGRTTYGHSYLPSYPNGRYATSQQI